MNNSFGPLIRNWLRRPSNGVGQRTFNQSVAGATDIGLKRKQNQDCFAVLHAKSPAFGKFFVAAVADGMGGMKDGADCAAIAMAEFLVSCVGQSTRDEGDLLREAALRANAAVYGVYSGLGGATFSAIFWAEGRAPVGLNVGDSRIYSVVQKKLIQDSIDDTLAGQLHRREPENPNESSLLQFIGLGDELQPHIINIDSDASRILITSDGAHYIGSELIERISDNCDDVTVFNRRILSLARWLGGHDNATILTISGRPEYFDSEYGVATVLDDVSEFTFDFDLNPPSVKVNEPVLVVKSKPAINKKIKKTVSKKQLDSAPSLVLSKRKSTKKKRQLELGISDDAPVKSNKVQLHVSFDEDLEAKK